MAASTATRRSAPPKAPKAPTPSFLATDQVEELDKASGDSRYVSFKNMADGKSYKFRFVAPGIIGWEYWIDNEDGNSAPVRSRLRPAELPVNVRRDEKGRIQKEKMFVAGVVYDYQTDEFAILQITQSGMRTALNRLIADEDEAGNPLDYAITIVKTGTGLQTKYALTGGQRRPLDPAIAARASELEFNLQNMFEDLDPWDVNATAADEDEEVEEEEEEEEDEEEVEEEE